MVSMPRALAARDAEMAELAVIRETFTRAVGFYDCPCGASFEFTADCGVEGFGSLNRWLGRHVFGGCPVRGDAAMARLERDNDMLRRENTALLTTPIGELQCRADELWSEVIELRAENRRLKGEK